MIIPDEVVDMLFGSVRTADGVVHFASTLEKDGWVVIWPDGQSLHTYRYPPDWLGEY